MNSFNLESKSQRKKSFFTKNPNLIFFFFLGGGGGGGGWERGRWVDSRTGSNQFAPSTSSKLGT